VAEYLGRTALAYLPAGAGAVARTIQSRLRDQVHLSDYTVVGADQTAALAAATAQAISSGKALYLDTDVTISTFATALSDATNCAVEITGSIEITGPGKLTSSGAGASNSVFGFDDTTGAFDVVLNGVAFGGTTRSRAFHAASGSVFRRIVLSGCTTDRQTLTFSDIDAVKEISINGNFLGLSIEAATAASPQISITRPSSVTANRPSFSVSGNTIVGGTETINALLVVHQIPPGGRSNGNVVINLGSSGSDGLDYDNVGSFCSVCGNASYGANVEFKVGTGGYEECRDIIFSRNVVYESLLSIQGACFAADNLVYNPPNGLFLTPTVNATDVGVMGPLVIKGMKIVWAGEAWAYAVRLETPASGAIYSAVILKDIFIEIDPLYLAANPGAVLPSVGYNISGDQNNITIEGGAIDASSANHILFRPATVASGFVVRGIKFGNTADSCIDLADVNDAVIDIDAWPATVGDRPARLSLCERVRITSPFRSSLALASASGTNIGVLINAAGQEAAGAGVPPSADTRWPLGVVVTNTTDGTVWLRTTESATPTNAWKLISPNVLTGSATFNPSSLDDGAGETTTVTVTGAALGDYAQASFSLDLQGITVTAWVSAANTVSVRFQNETGGTIDLGSGTLRARVVEV
jgi:hypothetical protein